MWLTYLQIALRVLRANLFRSTLTVASIVIGAFSIVLMTSLAESGFGTLSRSFEELGGARLISMWPSKPEQAEGKDAMHLGGIDRHDAEAVRRVPGVDLQGLMCMSPQPEPPASWTQEDNRPHFAHLRTLAQSLGLSQLSMGTTADYEVAIEEGATIVRVGRSIFGDRS